MSEKRFIVETVEITDCDTDESRISEVITDTSVTYSYENLEDVVDLLNEQQAIIQSLKEENEKLKITLSEYGVDFSSLDRFKEAIGYNEMVKKVLE